MGFLFIYLIKYLDDKSITEAATTGVLWKKVFLKILQNSQEKTCVMCYFTKKETLAQVLSCEFREIFKNNFFQDTSGVCFWH